VGRLPTEQTLVERASRGDADAYGQLVREHQEVAFRTAFLITSNAADAEEAAQDGFVKAYRALGRFRRGEPLRPWLLTIVANEARNRRKAAGRREQLARSAASGEPRATGAAAGPADAAVLSTERRSLLVAALGVLREEDRNVIACRHLLELSERETAAVLGCRPGTVKSRLSRALDRLRAELGEEIDVYE
jgi:RNA polymerase sigma factor (sigma-70 family)